MTVIPFPRRELVSIADVLRGMDAQPAMPTAPARTKFTTTRVHTLAREAGVQSHVVVRLLRTLGYEGIKSASSRIEPSPSPIERAVLVSIARKS